MASVGEKAKNMRAAMSPTGNNKNINGGGGSGGNIGGRITIEAARAAKTRTEPKLKNRTILIFLFLMMLILFFLSNTWALQTCPFFFTTDNNVTIIKHSKTKEETKTKMEGLVYFKLREKRVVFFEF